MDYIPLEKPVAELEQKIEELRRMATSQAINLDVEINDLEHKAQILRKQLFSNLTAYESTQLSRHPRRPNSLELINAMCSTFVELHGDRNFLDDHAIVGGLATLEGQSVIIIGHQKGRGTKDNIFRNFGMPRPEGYRKALRLMSMAERFKLPIITLIDTPGAYPGIDAEQRGQSEAIAKNIMVMSRLKVPIVTVVVGEGGSGGALALAVANRVHMLRCSVYSVISPEGCASILITSKNALEFGVIDSIIDEPEGGAHRSIDTTASNIKERIIADLVVLNKMTGDQLREDRIKKYLKMGFVGSGKQIHGTH